MKRVFILGIVVLMCVVLLASCFEKTVPTASTEHTTATTTNKIQCTEHVLGEYQSNESGHFREYTCGCDISPVQEDHIDEDRNGLCDVCKSSKQCNHVFGEETFKTFLAATVYPNHPYTNYVKCTLCNEVKLLIDEGSGEEFSIILGEGAKYYCINSIQSSAKVGDYVTVRVPNLDGKRVYVKINDSIYAFSLANDDYTTTFAFIMPDVDVTLDFIIFDKGASPDYVYEYFYYCDPWFASANANEIDEITYTNSSDKDNTSNIIPVYSITDKEDIARIISQFKWSPSQSYICSFPRNYTSEVYKFISGDEIAHSLSLINGNYNDGWDVLNYPVPDQFDSFDISYYRFYSISSEGQVFLYGNNAEALTTLDNISTLKFVPCNDEEIGTLDPTHYIETSLSTLYIVNNNTFYILDENGEKSYYSLIDLDFYDMISIQ